MAHELPESTVTVLFTDVEGSTDLATRRGDEVAQSILRIQRDLVRQQVEQHSGHEVKSLGDGFMVAFASARKAVACAVGIQRALEQHNRQHPEQQVQVRIGLNTGDAIEEEADLFGAAVNAAARVAAKAKGGQILLSETVRSVLGRTKDVKLVDCGRFRLKGFPERWRLYEAVWQEAGEPAATPRILITVAAGLLAAGLAAVLLLVVVCDGNTSSGKSYSKRISQVAGTYTLSETHGTYYYQDLETRETASFGASSQVPAASTVMVLVALEVERQVEAGLLDWTQTVTVDQTDIVGGTGVLQDQAGRSLTLEELVDTMLDYSDSTAGNILVRILGGFSPINELAQSLGLPDTRMERDFMDLEAQRQRLDNYTSVSDLAGLFASLERGQAISHSASASILAKLAHRQQVYPSWMGRFLPTGTVVASIGGLLPGERIEVSVLNAGMGKRCVLAVALTEQVDDSAAEETIAGLARDIYNAVSQ